MLSDDKITHLTHVLMTGLMDRDLIALKADDVKVRRTIKRSIQYELKRGEEMEQTVKRKIQSLSKKVVEGSPEWEVLYKKFLREEEVKRGM